MTPTLRDYFAATVDDQFTSISALEAVMNERAPIFPGRNERPESGLTFPSQTMAAIQWYATAKARLRYVMADAMLKESQR
jgi:hypothetical protein